MDTNPWNSWRAPWTPFDLWADLYSDGLRRVDTILDEVGRRSTMALEQADSAMNETARTGTDSMAFVRQVSEEWFRTARGTAWWLGGLAWPRWARPAERHGDEP